MAVPMLDELIQLSAAHGGQEVVIGMAHRGRLNVLAHNLGRPYDTIFGEFEGASTLEARDDDPAGRHGRRQVPPRHAGHLPAAGRRHDPRQPRVQPQPPRVRLAGGGGSDARGADLAPGTARPPGHQRGGADRDPRRRVVPRPGRGVGDLQPAGAGRLQGRRHGAHHHQQPGRLHDRPRRRALHTLGLGPGEGLRRADHPRQRRRRARVHQRGAPGVRVPQGVRPRRADRPDRLPPLRPQRVRRAGLHPAGDVRQDQDQEARLGAVGRPPGGRRRGLPGGGRAPGTGGVGQPHAAAPAPEGQDRGGAPSTAASTPPASTSSTARPAPRCETAVPAAQLRALGEQLLQRAGRLHRAPQAGQTARATSRGADRKRSSSQEHRLGARGGAGVRARC